MNLPHNLIPEVTICENGYQYSISNLKLENIGIVLYLENDVRELAQCKVYSSYCIGPCKCKCGYQGKEFLLLNLNNKYFIHYALLYEYSELMTHSRNPLFSYLKAKNDKLTRTGNPNQYKYHIMQHAWKSYLRLVDIDYANNFCCIKCKESPSIIILDGIAMGTTKLLPPKDDNIDESQQYPLIPIAERVYVADVKTRKLLLRFIESGLSSLDFANALESVKPEFAKYIVYCSEQHGVIKKVHRSFPLVQEVIQVFSRCESIFAIVRISAISVVQRKLLAELSQHKTGKLSDLQSMYPKTKFLELLINSLPPDIDIPNDKITLNENVAEVLMSILKQIQVLIRKPTRKVCEVNVCDVKDHFNCYPALNNSFKIPQYLQDQHVENQKNCKKLYPKHQRFSPGLLMMACQHRKCYGFEVMKLRESTVLIFNMLLKKFKTMPEVIIYDNACNLHSTCIMRDPFLFRNTTFLIDRFHSKNHQCNPIYSMNTWNTDDMRVINSQTCEQIFSLLRRIATQVAYMRIENVFLNSRYFLACWNKGINN